VTGCDDERERIAQEIAARVTRRETNEKPTADELQKAYEQCRRAYLKTLYEKRPAIQPETTPREENGTQDCLPLPTGKKSLL
jgi:hypothetical protein